MSIRYSDDFKKEVVKAYMAGDKSTVQIANGLTNTRKNASIPQVQPQNLMMQRKSED